MVQKTNPAQKEDTSQIWDKFAGIRTMLSKDINILHPKHSQAIQNANKKWHLNGEVPKSIREIIELFVPTVDSQWTSQTQRTMPTNLSRKQRKLWKEKNRNSTPSEPTTAKYTVALEKVKHQVFDAVALSQEELRTLYNAWNNSPDSTLTRFDEKYLIRLLSTLSIPDTVFEGVDPTVLAEYSKWYMNQKEHVETQYNYIWDMIRLKVMPLVYEALKAASDDPMMHYATHAKTQMNIAHALKEIYEHGCFCNEVPVQPWYIGLVFNHELKKSNSKYSFKVFIGNMPVHKFLNWIFAEVYGWQAINYFAKRAKDSQMNIYSVTLDETTKKSLDFYAKSDEQYYVKMPNGTEFLQSVDFKSYADGEPSIFPIPENDMTYQYRLPAIKQYIPAQLRSIPIYPIEFRVWVPSRFKGKLYTMSGFEKEFENLYQKYVTYIASTVATNLPRE